MDGFSLAGKNWWLGTAAIGAKLGNTGVYDTASTFVKLGDTGGCDTVTTGVKLDNTGGCDTVVPGLKLGDTGGCDTVETSAKLGKNGGFDAAVTGGKPELPNSLRLASVFSAIQEYRCLLWNPKFRFLIHKIPSLVCYEA